MKHILIVLFLIFIGCKDHIKTKSERTTETQVEKVAAIESGIDKSVFAMWNSFTEAYPEFKKKEIPDTDFFDYSPEEPSRLADLIVTGKKKAGSGLYIWYKEANMDLPIIGTKLIVTDFNGKAKAIIETKKVDTIPFNKVSEDYAELDMGTNIQPLEKWKKAHWEFFFNALEPNAQKTADEMLVVCEQFKTIWPKNH